MSIHHISPAQRPLDSSIPLSLGFLGILVEQMELELELEHDHQQKSGNQSTQTLFGGLCLFDGMPLRVPSSGSAQVCVLSRSPHARTLAQRRASPPVSSVVPPRRHALLLDFLLGP